ncbi:Hypp3860 [Branchiostoma lanceolatum]|uniref:Hypp3860 protein n=1 Tax=Branchiostoma lanceolatum TaxID=7740 RepID=A0A8K0EVU2_BRALA|nr:Hypp3860 [Branchiostoma lanceolatum]
MEVFTCKNASRLLSFLIILCMIIIGGVYRENCPINFLIPIYLIVYGVFLLVPTIGSIVHGRQDQDEAGNVWVYSAYPVVDRNNSTSPEYCHFALYDFAFTITTLVWITLALGLCAGVITVVCSVGKDGEDMS